MTFKSRKDHILEAAEELKKKFPEHADAIDRLARDMFQNPPDKRKLGDRVFFERGNFSTPIYIKCKDLE